MNKTERFRGIAKKHKTQYCSEGDVWAWYETEPGEVEVDGHNIEVLESTNFNVETEYAGPDLRNIWVIVRFENELYRLKGIYDSWSGSEFEDWQRIEARPVTKIEYVELDVGLDSLWDVDNDSWGNGVSSWD